MTPYYFWLNAQGAEFCKGYDDYCAGTERDKAKSKEYLRGYDKAQDDSDKNDYA